MEKKELKFYEAPELEVLDVNVEGALLQASGHGSEPGDVQDEFEG